MNGLINIIAIFALGCGLCQVQGVERPRGVSLEKASFYQGTEFRCLSNGKALPMDHVNDDYCDCEDGSDEPGTSACSNGLFYCENRPYKGSYIMTSRVNDGICDCCDGSDEYDGTIVCENTCEKIFAEIRAQQEAFRKKQEEGYKVKLEYIQRGRQIKEEKKSRLVELTKEKAASVEEKEKLQAAKEAAEVPEKEAKDKHEEAWRVVKEEQQKQKDVEAAAKAFADLDVNQDNVVDFPEIIKHPEFDIDSDGTVSEEEAKEYLEESEQADLATFTEKIWPNIKEIYKPTPQEGQPEGEAPAAENEEETAEKSEGQGDDEEKMPEYEEATKQLIAVADEARRLYNDADNKLRQIEGEITGIEDYLKQDFGPEDEYSALKGQCFEYTDREYTYKFCPFDKTSQKPKGGGMETSLGNWGHWHGPEDDKFDAMKYENGQGCWNGPNRSCHVNLHCGAENALTSASEPSRCEYQFDFTTPARCSRPEDPASHTVHEEL